MTDTLHDVLDSEREKVHQLGRDGFDSVPLAFVSAMLKRISTSADPFTDWLSEGEAKLRSNRSTDWLRGQFPQWYEQGLARWNPSKPKARQFLRAVVPMRANLSAARDAGMREAQNA